MPARSTGRPTSCMCKSSTRATTARTDIAIAEADELKQLGIDAEVLRRDSRQGYKAGALAAGLAITDQPFVVVFDVDFTPPPSFLKDGMRALLADERVGFVQARCDFVNWDANWLTRGQIMMLDAHGATEQPSRYWAGHPIQFDGSAGIWRRAAIADAGGWHSDTLSEDLDLSLRAQLAGWRSVFLFDHPAAGELAESATAWRRQHARWSSGAAQSMRKLLPAIWRSHLAIRVEARRELSDFAGLVLPADPSPRRRAASAYRSPRAGPWALNWYLFGISMLLLAFVTVGMTLPGHLIVRKGSLKSYLARVPTVPLLYFYLALVNIRQVMAGMFGGKLAFEKTPKAGETPKAGGTQ